MPKGPDIERAIRLLGFALFNLSKGNTRAAETLMNKAYEALTGRPWDVLREETEDAKGA